MTAKNLVLYTDGSFRDRKGGWGFHGYSYKDEPMRSKANLKAQPTKDGYKDVDLSETCTVSKYVDGFGKVVEGATSNKAELTACLKAMEYAREEKADTLKIISDSQYVLEGLRKNYKEWIRNGWRNSKGLPVKNKGLWEKLIDLKEHWKDKSLELIKIKGHSGDIGNDKADINALRGTQATEDQIHETKPELINRPKKIQISPLVLESRLLFSINDPNEDNYYFSYNLGRLHNAGIKSKAPAKHKLERADLLLGRRISEATFSVYKGNEPEDYLDDLQKIHKEALPNDDSELAIIDLNNACNARQRQQIESLGIEGLIVHEDIKAISTPEKALVSRSLNPPRLAYDAVLTFNNLKNALDDYLNGKLGKHVITLDITDTMFETKNSKDYKLLKSITNQTKFIEVEIEIKKKKQRLKVIPSIDIPTRNQLNKIAKILEKVVLIVSMTGPESFNYSIIFQTNEGTAIYSSPYVQLIL